MTLLLEAAIKSSIVIVVALGAAALLRRQSAGVRHWLLATGIVAAAAVPFASMVAPGWSVNRDASRASAAVSVTTAFEYELPVATHPAAARESAHSPYDAATWLVVVWLAGVTASLAYLAAGLWRLRAFAQVSVPLADDRWQRTLAAMSADLRLSRPVRLICGPTHAPLVTWGMLRPVLLVSPNARGWDDERIAIVLRHELAHVVRHDWAVQVVVAVVCAAYWFNPLMWIAAARLRRESEHACDDVVLAAGVRAEKYASHLVALARAAARPVAWVPAQSIVRPSQLQRRVRAMLHANVNRRPMTRAGRVAPVAAMLFVTTAVAGFGRAEQAGTVLSGTVADPTGRGIAGVTIVLSDAAGTAKHEVKSGASGRYEFVALPAGDYALRASVPGFMAVDEKLALSGAAMTRNLAMRVGMVEESIRVTAVPTPVRPSGTTLDERREKARAARANDPCAQSQAGGCLLAPVKLKDVKPVFPESLTGSVIAEPVILRATIGTDGAVTNLTEVSSPNPALTAAAMDAVRQWEFAPTQLNGVPIETAMRVTVRFER